MVISIGIRREDKNRWERRTPLIPEHVGQLIKQHHVKVIVQPSPIRIYSEADYVKAGAQISEDLSACDMIFGVKEMPVSFFQPGKTYIFFSHTLKGQKSNMPMLKRLLELGCNLIDYERIVDEENRRLVFFGRFAGIAGMIDSLWALSQRLQYEGITDFLDGIKPAYAYRDLNETKMFLLSLRGRIKKEGIPRELAPFIVGFAGYGNVSKGAREIFDLLPHENLEPGEIQKAYEHPDRFNNLFKVVFYEKDMVAPIKPNALFDLHDYYVNPGRYRSSFSRYLEHLSMLINCIYWEPKYPRLVTLEDLRRLYGQGEKPRLRVIGDISCDVEGAIEATRCVTSPDDPIYVYDPVDDRIIYGTAGRGPVILAVDNLPCELPVDASVEFSNALLPFMKELIEADLSRNFDELELSYPIRSAIIVHKGKLTPYFRYLQKCVPGNKAEA